MKVAPLVIHVARSGDIYFTEWASNKLGAQVRVVRMSGGDAGRLNTIAGNGLSDSRADEGAIATDTGLANPFDVFCDEHGDVLIAESDYGNHPRILNVSAKDGRVRVIAGSLDPHSGFFKNGSFARTTSLRYAWSVCVADSTVYFSDGYRVVRISSEGRLYIVAGMALDGYQGVTPNNSPAILATLDGIGMIRPGASDSELLITCVYDASIYRIDLPSGLIYVEAGVSSVPLSPDVVDGNLATQIGMVNPGDAVYDPRSNDVFIASSSNNVVLRMFSENGTMKVVTGNGARGAINDTYAQDATQVPLANPGAVALCPDNGLVILDRHNCLLLLVDLLVSCRSRVPLMSFV